MEKLLKDSKPQSKAEYHIEGGNLEEYAVLTLEIKNLEEKRDKIKVEIVADMKNKGEFTTKSYYGTFSMVQKPVYKFTKAVEIEEAKIEVAEDHLKDLKNKEIETGKAEVVEVKEHLSFRSV